MNEYGGKSDADLRVKVDAGHIKFNLRGFRWLADTPKVAKDSLIRFDRKEAVSPHNYVVVANRRTKIVPPSPERQARVNENRRIRIRAGNPDKPAKGLTLRKRIVGYA